jgi:hypothetical protein
MVLGAAGWLMADILDPTIRLAIPGTGTFDLCTVLAAGESCTTTLINGKPDTTIGDDGFGSFAVKNVDTTLTVDSISFEFQTNNLFQPFSAFTDDFHTVNIVRHFNEGCIFDLEQGCLNPVGMLDLRSISSTRRNLERQGLFLSQQLRATSRVVQLPSGSYLTPILL